LRLAGMQNDSRRRRSCGGWLKKNGYRQLPDCVGICAGSACRHRIKALFPVLRPVCTA
jgi:hypothetical protein